MQYLCFVPIEFLDPPELRQSKTNIHYSPPEVKTTASTFLLKLSLYERDASIRKNLQEMS